MRAGPDILGSLGSGVLSPGSNPSCPFVSLEVQQTEVEPAGVIGGNSLQPAVAMLATGPGFKLG